MATLRCAGRRWPLGCSACAGAALLSLLALELRELGAPCRRLPPPSPAPPRAQGANSRTRVLGTALPLRSGQTRLFFHWAERGGGRGCECPGSGRGVEDRALSEPPASSPLPPIGSRQRLGKLPLGLTMGVPNNYPKKAPFLTPTRPTTTKE